MQIEIPNPQFQTLIFSALLLTALVLSIRRSFKTSLFPLSLTNELKGLSILAVVFSHIGFFLSTDNRFLQPWSILAGVAVNLFLFLSGFGLTVSALKKPLTAAEFFQKRLLRLFIPLWITLLILLAADYLILHISYDPLLTFKNIFGFYPEADIFRSINSPLWFISIILFYYLIFPFFYWPSRPLLSAFLMTVASVFVLRLAIPVTPSVLSLYKIHNLAFPAGVALASLIFSPNFDVMAKYLEAARNKFILPGNYQPILRIIVLVISMILFFYLAVHSGVGETPEIEQRTSLFTMAVLILIFVLKNIRFSLLSIFGVYSYEIYLIHWPLFYRYGILYQTLPAYLSTAIYLALLLFLGYLLHKGTKLLLKPLEDSAQ